MSDKKSEQDAKQYQRYVNRNRREQKITPYLYIAPFFILFIIFQFGPILFSIFLSFAQWDGMKPIQFADIQNYATLFQDAKFWNAFRVTFIITAVCTLLGTAGSTLLAVLLEKVPDRAASILRVIFFLPSVTSVVVIAYVWKQLFNGDYGLFNNILMTIGAQPKDWLQDPTWAMVALLIMLIWAGLGWDALIITAGLRSIPCEIYDAGKVDGTNGWSEFWCLTLPLLKPTLLFVLVTGVIFLWGIYGQSQLLTGGGPLRATQTIAMYLYDMGFQYHQFGYASAIAIILSLLMFLSSYLNVRFIKYEEY